jgi:hypothetical protein
MKKDTSFCATIFDDTKKRWRLFGLPRTGAVSQKTAASCIQSAVLESLEDRRLMSTTAVNSVWLSNGVLYLQGSPTLASNITVNLVKNGSEIDASADHNHAMIVARSAVNSIQINGGSGNDYIYVDSGLTVPVTINGGEGNDQVRGGGGKNTIIEGNGNDWVSGRGVSSSITVGSGNDTLLGTAGPDTIIAGNGNDSIIGAGGTDVITAGNGNDSITGGTGNVVITAANGADSIAGGKGTDEITVGTGVSTIYAGTGTNKITLGNAKDAVLNYGGHSTISYSSPSTTPTSTVGSPATTSTGTGTASSGSTSTSSTSTGSTGSGSAVSGSTGWTTYSAPASSTGVRAVMQVLAPAQTVGIAIVVRALNSTLGAGTPINSNYQWNFGDPSGAFNTLQGFNAAHIYNTPGTYPITLTVTNYLHQTSTVTMTIKIAADTRRLIYVNSTTGSDSNNGSSPTQAVKTAGRADQLVGNNTEVLFDRGEEFNLSAAFKLNFTNVLVGAYGSGANPIINYTAPGTGTVIFTTNSHVAAGVTVSDLTLTSVSVSGEAPPMGVMAGGFDTSVVDCVFDYVEYDINASSAPVGLTAIGNSSPVNGDLQGYFVWDQGTDTTVLGNYVNGSVHEHVLRTSSATELLVDGNDFNNYDGKGCIEIHVGGYAWIQGNTVNGGDIRVGPLGLWGEAVDATVNCVIQGNTVDNTDIQVYPGAQNIQIENNVITRSSAQLIDVIGQDGEGRVSSNINILNNTGISTGTAGNFLKVENHTDGITLENNLYIANSLIVGSNNAAPVFVVEGNLSSFNTITGNVWQEPKFYAYAQGGINFINGSSTSSDYKTAAVWNSYSNVGTDYFSATPLDSGTFIPVVGSLATHVDSPVVGVFTDFYGTVRSATGTWAAGAV